MASRSAVEGISPLWAARSSAALSGAACPRWILLWRSANAGSCSATSTIEGTIDDHRAGTEQLGDVRQDGSDVAFERTGVRRCFLTVGHPRAGVDDERGTVRPVPIDGGLRDARTSGYVVDGELVQPSLRQQVERRRQHPLAGNEDPGVEGSSREGAARPSTVLVLAMENLVFRY